LREASETREPSAAKDLSERIPAPSWEPGSPVGASADAMLADKSPSAAVKIKLNSFPETNLRAGRKTSPIELYLEFRQERF
jgi:hypothetical protein